MDDLIERLHDEALALNKHAWAARDGGQDAAISANLATEAADRIAVLEGENRRLNSHVVRLVLERDDLRASLREVLPLSCEYSCERDGTGSGDIAVHSDVCSRGCALLSKHGERT